MGTERRKGECTERNKCTTDGRPAGSSADKKNDPNKQLANSVGDGQYTAPRGRREDNTGIMKFELLLLLLSSLHVAESYKILVYSAPLSFSHMQFVGRIADILQEAGHDVTVFHPRREMLPESAISAVAKHVIYELPDDIENRMSPENMDFWDKSTGSVSFQLKFVEAFTQLQKIGVAHIICASAVGVSGTMNYFFHMPNLPSITP
ncbi:hypothetical protein ANCDUO_18347, partial [Ancylostoma duodenale]